MKKPLKILIALCIALDVCMFFNNMERQTQKQWRNLAYDIRVQARKIQRSTDKWTRFCQPDGKIHIYDEGDMYRFVTYVNDGHTSMDAVLEADIEDYNFFIEYYEGHFDGQGHSISHKEVPLFMTLKRNALVENLVIADVDIYADDVGMSAVAHNNIGTIRNCQVSGRVEGSGRVGGIVSCNYGLIENCINYADIISVETAESEETPEGCFEYVAGGIAGTMFSRDDGLCQDIPVVTRISGCDNYGSVTADELSGGITGYIQDRTRKNAEELSGYSAKSHHFSLLNCKNYGNIMTNNLVVDKYECHVAGICPFMYNDEAIYHCANLGTVSFSESAPKIYEGWVCDNKPYAIVPVGGGLSPTANHVIDCVSLKGAIDESMRNESIMELAEEEFDLWERGELPYISNNWRFQPDEAVRLCSLEPLGVEKYFQFKDCENRYVCDEFAFMLPEGFCIEEFYLGDICYALHIFIKEDSLLPEFADYEVWLVRKEADVKASMEEVKDVYERWGYNDDFDCRFMVNVYESVPNFRSISISSLGGNGNWMQRTAPGKQIYIEYGIQDDYAGQKEGDHMLGNFLAIPLEGNLEDGLSAKWILVFDNCRNNIFPGTAFINLVEDAFFPFDKAEKQIQIRAGDSLMKLASRYTGDAADWEFLAALNGIDNPNHLETGNYLLVPDKEMYEKKPLAIDTEWFKPFKE